MSKLPVEFYLEQDVLKLSRELLGKVLHTNIDSKHTSGIIVETEAYGGITDKASHAYNNKRTKRTQTMYLEGGVSYIYLCYGMHHLFNVVSNRKDIPHAILIRALEPLSGIDIMLKRRKLIKPTKNLTNGPACLTQALGITTKLDGELLSGNTIWIEDEGIQFGNEQIETSKRIGIAYAEEDVDLPWRFIVK